MVVRKLTRHMSRHHDVNWALIDQAVVSGGNFITTLFIARGLGIDEFGRFTLAWMVVLFTASLHAASIAAPMMAIGPKQEPEDEKMPKRRVDVVLRVLVRLVPESDLTPGNDDHHVQQPLNVARMVLQNATYCGSETNEHRLHNPEIDLEAIAIVFCPVVPKDR